MPPNGSPNGHELDDSDCLKNLQDLVNHEDLEGLPEDKSIPIVLVPGFTGWGSPLLGAINYWGGIENIPSELMKRGHTLIVSPIAPISTNWERACELYAQLTCGRFNLLDPETCEIPSDVETGEDYDLDVDYGNYFAADPDQGPVRSFTTSRRRAILFSPTPEKYTNWTWSEKNKAHFVCHSQGGNTVRCLISLLRRGSPLHTKYFGILDRDSWAVSVTTLGTPHRGTTIIDVLKCLIPDIDAQARVLATTFATIAFQPQQLRVYDLQLDHWQICRLPGETFSTMRYRFLSNDGPVATWLQSKYNGFYDNSIEGVDELHQRYLATSPNIYYFSLSFRAVDPFPTDFPPWTLDAVNAFPILSIFRSPFPIPILSTISSFLNSMSSISFISNIFVSLQSLKARFLASCISLPTVIKYSTEIVANRFLASTNYKVILPPPGKFVPRADVLPLMLPSAYGIGGRPLSSIQVKILQGKVKGAASARNGNTNLVGQDQEQQEEEEIAPEIGDWLLNDGIVNTLSQSGPDDSVVLPIRDFPIYELSKELSKNEDEKKMNVDAKGKYWHLGTNEKMDHADEVGVFTDSVVGNGTRCMYINIAKLISKLPVGELEG